MSDSTFFRSYLDILSEQQPQAMGMDPVKSIEMQLTQAKEQKQQLDDQIRQLTTALAQAKTAQSQQQTQQQTQQQQPQGTQQQPQGQQQGSNFMKNQLANTTAAINAISS